MLAVWFAALLAGLYGFRDSFWRPCGGSFRFALKAILSFLLHCFCSSDSLFHIVHCFSCVSKRGTISAAAGQASGHLDSAAAVLKSYEVELFFKTASLASNPLCPPGEVLAMTCSGCSTDTMAPSLRRRLRCYYNSLPP